MMKGEPINFTAAEGEVFFQGNDLIIKKNPVTWEKIRDTIQNLYIVEQRKRQEFLIFTDEPEVYIWRTLPDGTEERDEQVEVIVTKMLSSPYVDAWSTMRKIWTDIFNWGAAIINPVWGVYGLNNHRILKALRRLPPESFREEAPQYSWADVKGEILKGIVLAKPKKDSKEPSQLMFYQRDDSGGTHRLMNVDLITDPTDTRFAGTPRVLPPLPFISMINFCLTGQMQKVNRIAAPIMFLKQLFDERGRSVAKVKNEGNRTIDDPQHAREMLANWGKNTGHFVPRGYEVVVPNFPDNSSAIETINLLKKQLDDYFSPVKMIQKEGSTIGGNALSELQIINYWIKSEHSMVELPIQRYVQEYLDTNGYKGYRAEINIPEPESDTTERDRQDALALFQTQSGLKDEIRKKLREDPLDEEKRKQIREEYSYGFDEGMGGLFGGIPLSAESEPQPSVSVESTPDIEDIQPRGQTIEIAPDFVLNGAQIQAALKIVQAVADGMMPRDAGLGQLEVLFNLNRDQAELIMGSSGKPNIPTTPNPKPKAEQSTTLKYGQGNQNLLFNIVRAKQHQDTPGYSGFKKDIADANQALLDDLAAATKGEEKNARKNRVKREKDFKATQSQPQSGLTQKAPSEFTPPATEYNTPDEVKQILAAAYGECRAKWANTHPGDIENQGNKEDCAKRAWGAVKNAGWSKNKDGNWKKE